MAKYNKEFEEDKDYQYHVMYLPRGVERLEKLGKSVIVPKDTELFSSGKVPECCYVVKSGSVIAYEYMLNGDQRIYNIMDTGSIFLEEALLFDRECPVHFKTISSCELIKIDKCDLKRAFKKDIDIVMDICESLSAKFLSMMEYQRFSHTQGAEWQLCKLLLIFFDHYGVKQPDGSILINRKISHQMIADILNMNRVTVTRKIKALKENDIIYTSRGFFAVKDKNLIKHHMIEIAEG